MTPRLGHPVATNRQQHNTVEFITDYALFLAKAITVVVAFAAIVIISVGVGRKGKREDGIEVTDLNERYRQITATLESALLPKKDAKAKAKADRKREKAESKAKNKEDKAAKKDDEAESKPGRRIFVLDFIGDIKASGVPALREEVTAILSLAKAGDEVLVRVENPGGMVHGHGLAASQLARIRDRDIPLTIAIDKVAASGGYLMACVAQHIVAAPFAIVGSIGVLAQMPNFNRLLERHGVDFEMVKAGEYKRSLTMFGKNTEEDREKMQSDVDSVHTLFKAFVAKFRPQLDIEQVATGEHWYGTQAVDLKLVDDLITSDDYLMQAAQSAKIYQIQYTQPQSLSDRLGAFVRVTVEQLLDRGIAAMRRF